ncbi:MAG: VOC family protein [Alphaproteobacteria bacterium]|nr:VOC family protein [Alphaproteobacteria bacterium]
MAIIKIHDIGYVRFRAPDLDQMEAFLTDFGLVRAGRETDRLYMRGTGDSPYCHVTEPGAPAFLGIGLRAASERDVERLARAEHVEVAAQDGPGGGSCVRLTDPGGFTIEVFAGGRKSKPLPAKPAAIVNTAQDKPRSGRLTVTQGPAEVKRLGHCVIECKDFRESEAWYKERFGFLSSDEIYMDGVEGLIGAFMRVDRGRQPVDHHTLVLLQMGRPGFGHAAFEVTDVNAVMAGHDHMKKAGHRHSWGIGRHILGSQIFDYWRDPWGNQLEHWTDGDMLPADAPAGRHPVNKLIETQWGPHLDLQHN